MVYRPINLKTTNILVKKLFLYSLVKTLFRCQNLQKNYASDALSNKIVYLGPRVYFRLLRGKQFAN